MNNQTDQPGDVRSNVLLGRKCRGHMDVPYTNFATGLVFWKEEPCQGEAIVGRSFCLWHDKPDFLPPEIIEYLQKHSMKPNVKMSCDPLWAA